MANAYKVTLNKTTPTLVWSGVGNVLIQNPGGWSLLGGPSVSDVSNGHRVSTLQMNVNSPDEIYGIVESVAPESTYDVNVLEVR